MAPVSILGGGAEGRVGELNTSAEEGKVEMVFRAQKPSHTNTHTNYWLWFITRHIYELLLRHTQYMLEWKRRWEWFSKRFRHPNSFQLTRKRAISFPFSFFSWSKPRTKLSNRHSKTGYERESLLGSLINATRARCAAVMFKFTYLLI